jgi:hypothetical protein
MTKDQQDRVNRLGAKSVRSMAAGNQVVVTACRQSSRSYNRQADRQLKAEQPRIASPIGEAATGDGSKSHDQESSVRLSVSKGDRTILTAIIDRTASQKRIIDDLRRALPQFDVPYRELERHLVEAIQVKSRENITFEQASIRVLGTPSHARTIRYWRNRWNLQ